MGRFIYRIFILITVLFTGISMWGQVESDNSSEKPVVWLKQGDVTNSGYGVEKWEYAKGSRYGGDFTFEKAEGYGKERPTLIYGDGKFNFNAVVKFSGNQVLASNGFAKVEEMTVFIVYMAMAEKTDKRMYMLGMGGMNPKTESTRHPAIGVSPGNGGGRFRLGYTNVFDAGGGGYEKYRTTILTLSAKKDGHLQFRFNGRPTGSKYMQTFASFGMRSGITLGGASSGDAQFNGYIGEVIIYSSEMSDERKSSIELYLALKYGVTLHDYKEYKLSNGDPMYNESTRGYLTNMAGLVYDRYHTVSVARSSSDGAVLTVSTEGTKFEEGSVTMKPVPLPKLNTAIMWATNKSSSKSNRIAEPTCGYNEMLDAHYWRFVPTNNKVGTVLEVRAGGDNFKYKGKSYAVTMLVAQTNADARAGKWINAIPGVYVGGKSEEHLFKLPISDKELYITFAAKKVSSNCVTCTSAKISTFDFSAVKWPKEVLEKKFTLDNGVGLDFSYRTYIGGVLDAKRKLQARGYPRAEMNVLVTKFIPHNGEGDKGIMEIKVTKAAKVRFNIYGIDKAAKDADEVEVIGYCGKEKIYPDITKINLSDQSFRIEGRNKITGVSRSDVKNRQGVVVDFTEAVERIEVIHKVKTKSVIFTGQDIAMGNFVVSCPRPAKANPDGLEFTSQAPANVVSCSPFNYTFQVWNHACDERHVDFNNVLPEGLEFVEDGLGLSDFASKDAIINDYKGGNTLSIKKLSLLPATVTTITAKVRFKKNAIAKVYENQASVVYVSKVNGDQSLSMNSCDISSPLSCVPTKVKMTVQEEVLPLQVSIDPIDLSCYNEESLITLKAKIKNPHDLLDYQGLEVALTYNNDFIFKKYNTDAIGKIEVSSERGSHVLNGVNLPRNGEINLSYELQAADFLTIIESATGKKYDDVKDVKDEDIALVSDFIATIKVQGWTDDECVNYSFEDAYAELKPEIPFCGKGNNTCYYPGLNGAIVKKNNDFVLMSTLDRGKSAEVSSKDINALLYLESKSKGFVITRMSTQQITGMESPVTGMLVYDLTAKCLKLYNGVKWDCLVQTCPDN